MAAENRAQLMAYSAAATAAALSVTALALTYSTFKGSTEGKSRTEGLTINNYGGQGSSSESYGSGTPTSNAPAASSPPSKLDSADGDTKDKPTDRYKRIIQFYNERECTLLLHQVHDPGSDMRVALDQWEDREEKKLTPEEEEEAKKLFFTARVREAKENPEGQLASCPYVFAC